MQTWTIDEMVAHKPCSRYHRARLEQLWDGRERLTVLDILDLDIPPKDRIWAALQAGPHVPTAVERIVTRAVETYALHCGFPEVERWAAKWLSGEDRTSTSAWSEWSAASRSSAAAWAAEAAARSAASRSAESAWAAESAARAASRSSNGASSSAREQELSRQLDDIREAVLHFAELKGDAG